MTVFLKVFEFQVNIHAISVTFVFFREPKTPSFNTEKKGREEKGVYF